MGEVVSLGWFQSEARYLLAPMIIGDVFDGTHDGGRALNWAVVMAKRRRTSEELVEHPESGCFLCSSRCLGCAASDVSDRSGHVPEMAPTGCFWKTVAARSLP